MCVCVCVCVCVDVVHEGCKLHALEKCRAVGRDLEVGQPTTYAAWSRGIAA